ncbi:MAG: ATP-binding cassette domain-containing protein [Bacilli bacterium]|nr:ATP-binding cassette domain-containing protein [Bacilli bacterium]
MLKLLNIKKDYKVAGTIFPALKGVSITFRDNEFVSILGPSGSGKTTLLNIIGGLDHYSDGDLQIDGVSTKEFNDKDWDAYRNHQVGFIFQSYNLIPHQSVLQNVELALTIAGLGKEERTAKAKASLEEVGLGDMINKLPNQLSGGQCQRVAIARALVNEPKILLADEPTGALDTKTSKQIMDLIKKISKDRLVIMVTHNPEIAEEYSTRIIRLLDGNITEDSDPFTNEGEKSKKKPEQKSKLSFLSAFRLSSKNLWSKRKRTLMVSFAGSIGIVGVATVLAVSSGVKNYIASLQDDMLSGNPVTISENSMDLASLVNSTSFSTQAKAVSSSLEDGYVNVDFIIEEMIKSSRNFDSFSVKNNINEDYIRFLDDMPKDSYAALQKYYSIDPTNNIYTDMHFTQDEERTIQTGPYSLSAIKNMCISILKQEEQVKQYADLVSAMSNTFSQSIDNEEYILEQYDVVSDKSTSKFPMEEDEIMIVLNNDDMLTDLLLTELGYYTQEEFTDLVYKFVYESDDDPSNDPDPSKTYKEKFSFEELLGKEFIYYPNDMVYSSLTWIPSSEEGGPSTPTGTYNFHSNSLWEKNGMKMKITTILTPKDNINYGSLSSGFYFTSSFTQKFINDGKESVIVNDMNEHGADTITSMAVKVGDISMKMGISYEYDFVYKGEKHHDVAFVGSTNTMSALSSIISSYMGGGSSSSSSIYTLDLRDLGGNDLPSRIEIYPNNFNDKDRVTNYLDTWNEEGDIALSNGKTIAYEDRDKITYNDTLAIVISMINTVINIITYALVAFTALSLVVSTVMIAIITYVSVIERVKEIGVIRSLGGRKGDVANLFIAETLIIGASSGVIGIAITYFLELVINLIVGGLSGIYTIAALDIPTALVMISIAIILTTISGIIPAMKAANQDPVDALRSE